MPVQVASAHSTPAPASLDAVSVRTAGVAPSAVRRSCAAAVSPTCELDSLVQLPAVAVQFASALVSRTAVTGAAAAAAGSAAGAAGASAATRPVVAVAEVPRQAAVVQSTHASAEETAVPAASTIAPGVRPTVRVAES